MEWLTIVVGLVWDQDASQPFILFEQALCKHSLFSLLKKMFSVRRSLRLLHTLPNVKTRSPSATDYTIKIMASANSGHFADCLKTSAQIKSAGMKPDASIYNALMSLAARDASWLFSWAIFDDMLLSGVKPTSTTFAHLVNVTHAIPHSP